MDAFVGRYAEVCIKEGRFRGSYYVAEVVARTGKDKFTVKYLTPLAQNHKKAFKEIVQASDVRPVPPQIRVSGFEVLDQVDAYDHYGWWVGRVTGRKDGSTYSVYFDSFGDENDYPVSDLRVHQEYEEGQWVPSHHKGMSWVM